MRLFFPQGMENSDEQEEPVRCVHVGGRHHHRCLRPLGRGFGGGGRRSGHGQGERRHHGAPAPAAGRGHVRHDRGAVDQRHPARSGQRRAAPPGNWFPAQLPRAVPDGHAGTGRQERD